MEKNKERKFLCKFCNKMFPSGKSLGGHIRIHTIENLVDHSNSYNGNHLREKNNLVDQREIVALKQQQLWCRQCGLGFDSLQALWAHMDFHSEGKKMLMDSQSDTEISSAPTRKRSKRVKKQSNSESCSNGSFSSASEIDQEHKNTALSLMMMSRDSKGHNLAVNSLAESSENNSVIVETKSSSGEQLKISNKVAVDDKLRSAVDNGALILSDSDSSDSDYFMNGPKESNSNMSVDGSLSHTGFGFNNSLNRFRNSDELRIKEGRSSSMFELKVFKSGQGLETDSCAETNNKIHSFSDNKSSVVKKAKKKSKGHECPICFKVFKSGQALGGHKRSHSMSEHNVDESS